MGQSRYESIAELSNTTGKIISKLEESKDLFDEDIFDEFKRINKSIEKDIKRLDEKNRVLKIGVVGAVKAGKSSFLNACFYDGEDVLPKKATSMTAALTKLTYGPENKAIVHFYDENDFEIIKNQAARYDQQLDEEYATYEKRFNERNAEGEKQKGRGGDTNKVKGLKNKEEYKKNFKPSEQLIAAKETMEAIAKHGTDLAYLGKELPIDGGFDKYNEYIAGEGKFTPIVSYVEIQSDDKRFENFEIIDTPGLNDAIVSRSRRTKDFLRDCDVVLLLSPCAQFMDDETIRLMCNQLPANNINKILVVGSRLDQGILNLNEMCSIQDAYKRSVENYCKSFGASINRVIENADSNAREIMSIMKDDLELGEKRENTVFTSSMLYSAGIKLKNNKQLNEDEIKMITNLKKFSGMEENPDALITLSGIKKVIKRLYALKKESSEILDERDSKQVKSYATQIATKLADLRNEIESNNSKLETDDIDGIKKKSNQIDAVLRKSGIKISAMFQNAALDCEKRSQRLISRLKGDMAHCSGLETQSKTESHYETRRAGFLGLRKENYNVTETNYEASSAEVKINLQKYAAKCIDDINGEFDHMISEERLAHDLKEIVIEAFHQSESNYEEDEILAPLSTVLKRIQIPKINLGVDKYIDIVNSNFPNGYARNEDIHRLESLQASLLNMMDDDYEKQLKKCLDEITDIMSKQALTFVDEIQKKIENDRTRLIAQLEDKERYIELNRKFIDDLKDMKASIVGLIA